MLAAATRPSVSGDGLKFAARALTDKAPAGAAHPARRGRSALARDDKGRWAIAQVPQAEAAFVAVSTRPTAPSSRSSAASTSTATSSTT